jgi:predicted ATPase
MREGLAAWRATGSKFHVPYRLARAGDRWFVPELHRLKGELLLEAGRRDEVEACLTP